MQAVALASLVVNIDYAEGIEFFNLDVASNQASRECRFWRKTGSAQPFGRAGF